MYSETYFLLNYIYIYIYIHSSTFNTPSGTPASVNNSSSLHVCMYMHVKIHTSALIASSVRKECRSQLHNACIYIHTHTHTYIHIHTHTQIHIHTLVSSTSAGQSFIQCMCIHTHKHTYIYIHAYISFFYECWLEFYTMHVHTHTHI